MDKVYDFLRENSTRAYSTRTLKHKFGIKLGELKFHLDQYEGVRRVLPIEVGSGKAHLNVYKAK